MNGLVMKYIILIIICVTAADESTKLFVKKHQLICTCKIINSDIAVWNIDDNEHIHEFVKVLITFHHRMEKLEMTILAPYETNLQMGKCFLY